MTQLVTDSKKENLRVAGIIEESIVDGPGIRFSIFSQGCPHNCKGCHNPETHDFKGGYDITHDEIMSKIKKNPLIKGVTFSGGEPFCQSKSFYELAVKIKELNKNILIYTGFTFEELLEMAKGDEWVIKLMENTDIIVDGKFVESQKSYKALFRGSENQKIIDVKASLSKGEIVEMDLEGEK